jgi:hypothetical protein
MPLYCPVWSSYDIKGKRVFETGEKYYFENIASAMPYGDTDWRTEKR